MRGSRVKALRQSFKDTYGFNPPKSRWTREKERPKSIFKRFWWWLTRYQPPEYWRIHQSMWRRWKSLAKEGSRAQSTDNRPRGRTGRRLVA